MKYTQWIIEKIKDSRDFRKGTRIVYTGSIAAKPKGWRVIGRASDVKSF